MKKKDIKALRSKKRGELEKLLSEKRKESIKLWAEMKAGKVKNLKAVKNLKHDIAQILSVIREADLKSDSQEVEKK